MFGSAPIRGPDERCNGALSLAQARSGSRTHRHGRPHCRVRRRGRRLLLIQHREGHAAGEHLREVRLHRPVQAVHEGPPERHDRGDGRGRPRQVQHPADPADRRGLWCGRRRRHRGGPGRELPPERRQVRQPPAARVQRPQGQLVGVEVRRGHHRGRQDHDRARHRRRRSGHVLPNRPVRQGGPARPTAPRSPSCGRRGTTTSPPARSTRQGSRTRSRTSSTAPPTPTTRSSCSPPTTPTSTARTPS